MLVLKDETGSDTDELHQQDGGGVLLRWMSTCATYVYFCVYMHSKNGRV